MKYTLGMIDGTWWAVFKSNEPFKQAKPEELQFLEEYENRFFNWMMPKHPGEFMSEDSALIVDGTLEQVVSLLSMSPTWARLLQNLMKEEV